MNEETTMTFFNSPDALLRFANQVLWVGLVMLLVGILCGYLLDQFFGLLPLIAFHGMVIFGPTLLKLGYVMRLTAQYQLRKEALHAVA